MIADSVAGEWENSLPKTDGIYRLIENTMNRTNREMRIRAIAALGTSGDPRAVQSLIDCCQDTSPEVRLRAIEGLQNLRSGRSVEALVGRITDRKELPEIRQRAAAALAATRCFSSMEALQNRCDDPGEDTALRTFIRQELDRLYSR